MQRLCSECMPFKRRLKQWRQLRLPYKAVLYNKHCTLWFHISISSANIRLVLSSHCGFSCIQSGKGCGEDCSQSCRHVLVVGHLRRFRLQGTSTYNKKVPGSYHIVQRLRTTEWLLTDQPWCTSRTFVYWILPHTTFSYRNAMMMLAAHRLKCDLPLAAPKEKEMASRFYVFSMEHYCKKGS